MQRREFIGLVGGAASWPLAAWAQQSGRIPVVGVLWHAASQADEGPNWVLLQEAFQQAGFIPGKNIILEERYPAEIQERFDSMAAELVSMNVDVLLAIARRASLAVKKATSKIPTVVAGDPVGIGLVASYAHPGGNITGASFYVFELDEKRLQLFRQTLPKVSRLALISNPDEQYFTERNRQDYATAGRALGIEIEQFEARNKAELEVAFGKIRQSQCEGVLIGRAGLFDTVLKHDIAELALAARLPTMGDLPMYPPAGCLMSYSASSPEVYSIAVACVKRILAGEKPADIPVQVPTKFDLAINLKTAKALGITVPDSVLVTANVIIE